jgi:hypothetical protein
MSRPLLQLALDHTSLQAAQRDVALLQDHVDIVEAGTILCLTEGLNAVTALRAQCPEKIIVADWKVADAGETSAQQAWRWRQLDDHHLRCAARHGRKATRGPACGAKFRWSCSATGRWMTPAPGTVPASIRRFTIADAMPGQRAAVGGGGSGAHESALRHWP